MRRTSVFGAFVGLLLSGACTAEQLGFPRVPVRAVSPDGRYVAFVRNHPELDPPNQSLWLGPIDGRAVQVQRVPPDAWTCERIAWAADSSRVAFVMAEAVVQVYEAASARRIYSGWVGRRSWDQPPGFILRDLSLTADGSAAIFRECVRKYVPVEPALQNPRGTRLRPVIEGCTSGPVTVSFATIPAQNHW